MQEQPNVCGLLGASKERLGLNKDGGKVLDIGSSIGGVISVWCQPTEGHGPSETNIEELCFGTILGGKGIFEDQNR